MTLLLMWTLGCGDKDTDTEPVDSEADTDTDTDSDTDTDVEACTAEQLSFAVTVGDDGGPCTNDCVSPVDVGGTVRNTGEAACNFDTTSSCLAGRATIGPAEGGAPIVDVKPSCDDAITTWTLTPGGTKAAVVIENATVGAGAYKATVFFDDPGQAIAVGGFDVP